MSQYGEHDPANAGRYDAGSPYGAGPGGPVVPAGPPPSTKRAIMLIWVGVALSVISTIIGFTMVGDLVDQSIDSQPNGTTVDRDTVQTIVAVTLVITLIITVGIAALFAWLLGKGKNWARIVYTVLAVLGALFGLLGIAGQPAILLVFQLIGLLLTIAVLALLYQRDSNQFFSRS